MTRIFTVTVERGHGDWWVLEAPDVGVVSQVQRLDQVEDEMREAVAHLAGLPESEVEVDVRATLPEDCVEHVEEVRRGGCARGRWGFVGRVLSGCGWSRGLWVVQICCKGRCGVRVVEVKPHDSAVLSAVRGVRGRLCNRFGHRARVRCPIRVRCRLAGRALSRGSPVAGPRVRGSIPGLVRRAGLHKQGFRAPSRVPVANPSGESAGARRGAVCRSQWRPQESRRAEAPRELLPR